VDRVILRVASGRAAFERAVLSPGEAVRVGRTDRADLVVADDRHMSAIHFSLAWSGARCVLTDGGSVEGVLLNGERAERAEVTSGAWIRAGHTDFAVHFERHTPPPEVEPHPAQAEAFAALHAEPYPPFALLDAARDPRILTLLRESVDVHKSLFEGAKGRAVDEQAPYLVELRDDSDLCERLFAEGWGRRWGVYLTSRRPFHETRSHLRRFLMVEDEETGEPMYFRFYDPVVLRVFLAAAGLRHREAFFSEIDAFLLEGERGEALRFGPTP
jgi:predicted component of type VI protein secretion system